MSFASTRKTLLSAAFVLMPSLAFAHPGHSAVNGLMAGMLHPLTGVDHLLAIFAAGLLAARLGGKALWAVPAAFLLLMATGGVAAMAGAGLPFTEIGIALSVMIFGGLVAFDIRLPLALASVGAGVFALFHGFAHGAEMPLSASGFAYAAGFLGATATLLGFGVAFGAVACGRRFGASFIRLAGGLASVAGLGFFVTALAG